MHDFKLFIDLKETIFIFFYIIEVSVAFSTLFNQNNYYDLAKIRASEMC